MIILIIILCLDDLAKPGLSSQKKGCSPSPPKNTSRKNLVFCVFRVVGTQVHPQAQLKATKVILKTVCQVDTGELGEAG